MIRQQESTDLGRGIATVLRLGTLLAAAAIAAGFVSALVLDDRRSGPTPVIDLLRAGGPDALIGVGLLGMTIIPAAALAVAALGLARVGERAGSITAGVVLLLLAVSFVTAALVGGSS